MPSDTELERANVVAWLRLGADEIEQDDENAAAAVATALRQAADSIGGGHHMEWETPGEGVWELPGRGHVTKSIRAERWNAYDRQGGFLGVAVRLCHAKDIVEASLCD